MFLCVITYYLCSMKPNILIVEDDLTFGTMLKGWFMRNGYVATLAGSMAAANVALGNESFDLIIILLDLCLLFNSELL